MPGTGWPEPGGFLPREALKMVGLVAAEGLCGMEIVEVRAQHATHTGEEPATRRRRPLSHTTNALPSLSVAQVSPPYDHADITSLMALRVCVDVLGSMVAHGKMGLHKSIIDKPFVPF